LEAAKIGPSISPSPCNEIVPKSNFFFSNSAVFNPVETILKIRAGDVNHYEDFTFLSRQDLWAELSQESYRGFPLQEFTGESKNGLGHWVILPNKDALLSSLVGSGLDELNSRCNVSDGPSTVEIIQLPLIKTKQKFVILFMVHSNYQKKVFF